MSEARNLYTGGCLCGAVRYEAEGEPLFSGHCYCADCRKASGSGFVPFMGFPSGAVRVCGQTRQFASKTATGAEAVRNFCPVCGSLVFGGGVDEHDSFNIYAGSLDDPSCFRPKIAIFALNRPAWAILPPDVAVFDEMPPRQG
jgi:hypothetical protein